MDRGGIVAIEFDGLVVRLDLPFAESRQTQTEDPQPKKETDQSVGHRIVLSEQHGRGLQARDGEPLNSGPDCNSKIAASWSFLSSEAAQDSRKR